MKNTWLFLLLALPLFSAKALITSPGSNAESVSGATVKYDQVFIQVKNVTAATVAKGELLFAHLHGNDNGYEATKSTTKYETPLCVADQQIAAGAFGRCLVYGYTDSLYLSVKGGLDGSQGVNAGAATAGQALFASVNDAGYATGALAGVRAASHHQIGYALDSAATSGTVEAFIKLL